MVEWEKPRTPEERDLAKVAGLSPKTPWMGVEGQFEGHESGWETINSTPRAYIEYKAQVDAMPGETFGPPRRVQYEPQIQAEEELKDFREDDPVDWVHHCTFFVAVVLFISLVLWLARLGR